MAAFWFAPILVVVVLAAPGCARYAPLPLDAASGASALEQRSLQADDLRAFVAANLGRPLASWPPASWDLETLTLAAWFYSPDLDLARAAWGSAVAAEKTAAARPNPNVGVTPERAVHQMGAPSPWVATVAIDIPIETAGKRGYRMAASAALSEAARQAIGTTAWRVRSVLRDALFDREASLAKQQWLRERVKARGETLDLYEARVAAGAASSADTDAIRLALEQARSGEGQQETAVAEADAAVAAAIGIPASALAGADIRVPLAGADALPREADARRRALEGRADVLAALSTFAASQEALQLEIAKQYPDVHLGTGYSYDQGNDKWNIGLSVDLPVLDRNEGGIAEAEAARHAAVVAFTATQAAALADVDAAYASAGKARANVESAAVASRAARRQRERMQGALRAGAVDRVEAGAARFDEFDAGLAEVDARLAMAKAFGKLEDAVQAPLAAQLEQDPRRAATPASSPEDKR